MAERRVARTATFEKSIKQLSRKHAGFDDAVTTFLNDVARGSAPRGMQIPGLGGVQVYKVRLPLGRKGKSGGARLIYYFAPDLVLAMYAFAKRDAEDIPVKQIRDALSSLLQQGQYGGQPD